MISWIKKTRLVFAEQEGNEQRSLQKQRGNTHLFYKMRWLCVDMGQKLSICLSIVGLFLNLFSPSLFSGWDFLALINLLLVVCAEEREEEEREKTEQDSQEMMAWHRELWTSTTFSADLHIFEGNLMFHSSSERDMTRWLDVLTYWLHYVHMSQWATLPNHSMYWNMYKTEKRFSQHCIHHHKMIMSL